MNKTCFAAIISILLLTQSAFADNDIPWAKPQNFSNDKPYEVPLFERNEQQRSYQPTQKVQETQTLEPGIEGDAVMVAQQKLMALGFALPAGADGDFGGQTEAAVKAFQSSRGLTQTGVLDPSTLRSLNQVSPAPGKMVWEDPNSAGQAVAKQPVLSGQKARVLIDLSEHRLTVYSNDGSVQRVFPVASGANVTPTHTGIKVVNDKIADPKPIADKLWPESKGAAFGTRMIDLSWYDPASGVKSGSGEELHGTFVRQSIGCNASHGCVRLNNEDVEWVYQNLNRGDIVVIQD